MTAISSRTESQSAICFRKLVAKGLWPACLAVSLALGVYDTPAADQTTPSNLAQVVTATYLGAEGNNWLSAAAFPGDDSIVIGGVSVDADITLLGVTAKVLGSDGSAPKIETLKEFKPIEKGSPLPGAVRWSEGTGAQKVDYQKFFWLQPEATGFIGRFSSDLKKVHALRRLPRGAGSVTSMEADKTGAIYVTGAATEHIANMLANRQTETAPNPDGVKDETWGCHKTYLAKLSPDLAKVVWLVEINGFSVCAPKLRILKDGNVSVFGPGLRVYDPDGHLVASNYDWITPSADSLAPGDVGSYKIVVPLDPNIVDTTGYTYKTLVKGEVK